MPRSRLFFLPLVGLLMLAALPAAARDWVVAADGSGDYRSVQAAIDAVPDGNRTRQVIVLREGLYRGVVKVPKEKTRVMLRGAGAGASILSWNNYADLVDPATGKAMRTSGSATVYVYGDEFIAEDLTIENTAGNVGQALALYAAPPRGGFRNVRLLGNQDTLYTHEGSVLHFKDCYIEGTVDFIFGAATALFDDCTIVSKGKLGWVTAASTPEGQRFGYVFRRALLRGEGVGTAYLGRSHARCSCSPTWARTSCRPAGTTGTSPMPNVPLTTASSAASVPVPHRKSAWRGRITCPVTRPRSTPPRRCSAAGDRSPDFARSGGCACVGRAGANLSGLKGLYSAPVLPQVRFSESSTGSTTKRPIGAGSGRAVQS